MRLYNRFCGYKVILYYPVLHTTTPSCWYLTYLFNSLELCVLCAYLSLSVELELSWCCASEWWKEVEAEAPLEHRADGHSEDPPILRLHCVERPRPGGNHVQFTNNLERKDATEWPKLLLKYLHELLLRVWSLSECSSRKILSMVCFLSWSSWSLVSLALAAVAPVSSPVCGPEAEWRSGLCWGGPTAWGVLDQHTSLERERLSAWRRLSGTALVYRTKVM